MLPEAVITLSLNSHPIEFIFPRSYTLQASDRIHFLFLSFVSLQILFFYSKCVSHACFSYHSFWSVNSLQPSYLFSRYRFGFLWHISYLIWDSLPTFCSRVGGFAVTFYLAYWYLRKSNHINYNSASSGSCQWSFGYALSHCSMFIVSHSFIAHWDMESGIWLHSDTFTQRPGFSVQVCLSLALKNEHRA